MTIHTRMVVTKGDKPVVLEMFESLQASIKSNPSGRVRAVLQCDSASEAEAVMADFQHPRMRAARELGNLLARLSGDPQELIIRRWDNDVHLIIQDEGMGEPERTPSGSVKPGGN